MHLHTRNRGTWLVALLLCLCAPHVRAEDDAPCTVRDGDNFYDLRPLTSKTDYTFKSPEGHNYTLNLCAPVRTELWAPQGVEDMGKVAGFTRREHGDFSLGNVNTVLEVRDGHPALTMDGGSSCPIHEHMKAATTIHFKCDTSVFGAGEPKLIAQLPPPANQSCYFFIEWRTHVACPTRARGGNWGAISILATIAGILFSVYIIVGMFYNYFILGLRGFDMIPRYSLFSFRDTANLVRTCIGRVKERSGSLHLGSGGMGSWGGRFSGGYRGLAGSREEEAGMLSGPPGYLDEEDEEEHHESQPQGMDANGGIRL